MQCNLKEEQNKEDNLLNDWQRMIPTQFTKKLRLPVSFDVKEHRGKNYIAIYSLMFVVFVALSLFTFAFIFSENTIFVKLLIVPIWYIIILFYRIVIFKEGKISDAYEQQKAEDYKTPLTEIWNAYDIDDKHPYVVHYMNNYKGIFIRFKKDVTQGKVDDIEYQHYQAISSAYQKAHDLGLSLIPIDYMDNVGNDPRLDSLYSSAERGSNPELESMLLGVYSNLKNQMSQEFSSFDVILMYMRTTPDDLWFRVRQVLDEYRGANYKSFEILNSTELLTLTKEIYNLENFSIYEAEKQVLDTRAQQVLRPILLTDDKGNVTKLNKTYDEEEAEKERKRLEAQESKQQKSGNKVTDTQKEIERKREEYTVAVDTKEVLDLFGETRYASLHAQAEQGFVTQETITQAKETERVQHSATWIEEVDKQDKEAKENLKTDLDLF